MKRLLFVIALPLLLVGCSESTRHVVVQADATFAQSVFALDETYRQTCESTPPKADAATCAAAEPKIALALDTVKRVTGALQAQRAGKTQGVPKDLPTLLTALQDLRAILTPVGDWGGSYKDLLDKSVSALSAVVALLQRFTGEV